MFDIYGWIRSYFHFFVRVCIIDMCAVYVKVFCFDNMSLICHMFALFWKPSVSFLTPMQTKIQWIIMILSIAVCRFVVYTKGLLGVTPVHVNDNSKNVLSPWSNKGNIQGMCLYSAYQYVTQQAMNKIVQYWSKLCCMSRYLKLLRWV